MLPNGVIRVTTGDFGTDEMVKEKLERFMSDNPQYCGAENNCSDFSSFGIKLVIDENTVKGGEFGKEEFYFSTFTTPNELFKDTKEYVNSSKIWDYGEVLKEDGDFSAPFITDESSGGWGESQPDKK